MSDEPRTADGAILLGPRLTRVEHALSGALRRLRAATAGRVRVEEAPFTSAVGYRIQAWIHHPPGPGPHPAVVLCPDGLADAGSLVTPGGSPVTADELARLGVLVLRFDPAGRGGSWGEEDHGGPEHQDEVAEAARLLAAREDVDATRIGLVGLGDGAVMAVGAAALAKAPVAWVLDWEGPSDREIAAGASRGDTAWRPPGPADEAWWTPREPVRHVGDLPCGYVRLQSEEDHLDTSELRHARRMLFAASRGSLPWFQINDHARGAAPERPIWLLSGRLAAGRALRRKIVALSAEGRRRA
jgi:hypothetical protein